MAVVVVVLGPGCSSGSQTEFTAAELDEWMGRTAPATEPTSAVYSYIGVYDDEWRLEATDRLEKQQKTVARCMTEAGFEFVPYVADTDFDQFTDDPWGGMTHRAYVKKWGYGLSTTRNAAGQVLDAAPGFGGREDPNEAVIATLSSEERAAYQVALYGDLVTAEYEPDADGNVPVIESGGCTGEGYTAVGGVGGIRGTDDTDWQEFTALYAEVGTPVDESDALADAGDRYRSCMDDAGYPEVKRPDDGVKAVRKRIDDAAASFVDRESFTGAVAAAGPASDPKDPVDADDIDQLREFELTLATNELPCLANYRLTEGVVRTDVEEAFIEEHRDLLDRIRSKG